MGEILEVWLSGRLAFRGLRYLDLLTAGLLLPLSEARAAELGNGNLISQWAGAVRA